MSASPPTLRTSFLRFWFSSLSMSSPRARRRSETTTSGTWSARRASPRTSTPTSAKTRSTFPTPLCKGCRLILVRIYISSHSNFTNRSSIAVPEAAQHLSYHVYPGCHFKATLPLTAKEVIPSADVLVNFMKDHFVDVKEGILVHFIISYLIFGSTFSILILIVAKKTPAAARTSAHHLEVIQAGYGFEYQQHGANMRVFAELPGFRPHDLGLQVGALSFSCFFLYPKRIVPSPRLPSSPLSSPSPFFFLILHFNDIFRFLFR